jgi:hypothetical protein
VRSLACIQTGLRKNYFHRGEKNVGRRDLAIPDQDPIELRLQVPQRLSFHPLEVKENVIPDRPK